MARRVSGLEYVGFWERAGTVQVIVQLPNESRQEL